MCPWKVSNLLRIPLSHELSVFGRNTPFESGALTKLSYRTIRVSWGLSHYSAVATPALRSGVVDSFK